MKQRHQVRAETQRGKWIGAAGSQVRLHLMLLLINNGPRAGLTVNPSRVSVALSVLNDPMPPPVPSHNGPIVKPLKPLFVCWPAGSVHPVASYVPPDTRLTCRPGDTTGSDTRAPAACASVCYSKPDHGLYYTIQLLIQGSTHVQGNIYYVQEISLWKAKMCAY